MWCVLRFGTVHSIAEMYIYVYLRVFGSFYVMERVVPNCKNIKNLKFSKLNSAGFCIKWVFLENEFYNFIGKYFRF